MTTSLALLILASAIFLMLPLPGDISILMYHFAGSEEESSKSNNTITLQSFKTQMKYLRWFRYHVISMEEYEQIHLKKKAPRGREVVLTFDDGNQSYFTEFFPVLESYGYPSTIFLISESVKHQSNGSMSEEMIKVIMKSPLVTLAGHTKTHPFLTEVSPDPLKDEVMQSKKDLETMFGRPMDYFSYPFGDFNELVMKAVQDAGYLLAFTTSPKKLKHLKESLFSITRIKMGESNKNPVIFLAMTSGIYQNFKRWRQSLR